MTGLGWLAQNIHNPWIQGTDFGLWVLAITYWVMDAFRVHAAKGTHRRYVIATFMVSIGPVVVGAYVWSGVEAAAQGGWGCFLFVVDILLSAYVYRHWRKLKDEDSWWNGRGKKIWKAVKGKFTVRALTPAPIPS